MAEDAPSLKDIPTTLDDIVRRNRDRFEVGLATAAELAAVTGGLDSPGTPRGRIDDWRVIALRHRAIHQTTLHLLGRFEDARAWLTSSVVAMAADHSRVRTRNSFYLHGLPAENEPDVTLLLHVAFVLRWWGLDQRYDLGVIPVYY
jgi:hypothetical protein